MRLEVLILETFTQMLVKSDTTNFNKYKVKTRKSLRFWENKGWINEIDPHGSFQWYFRYWLGRRSEDYEKQINRSKKLLVKMIKDAGSKFDDY